MKTIALILTAVALASCASDSGHHTYHPAPGRTEPPRVDDREPIRPIPGGGFGGIFLGGGHRDIGTLSPGDRDRIRVGGRPGLRPDVFGAGRDDAPEVMPSDPPRLGEPSRAPGSRFLDPGIARRIPLPSPAPALTPPPARRPVVPPTIIPRLPTPRPAESARITPLPDRSVHIPARVTRITPGSSALHLDRSALSR
ncbi:hypothetical protein OVA24_01280 [Luteolibacter sp. SL250]|uniref:hypothetical protein n=1 Tax=Luteolibacter sp. SL250 TaxID=2995170 RepID=UPI00227006A0|nr:hypothetical protein [Luteolibacter sp. SL250]WAC20009.1 hypothetical protein OVA24_01280 [Luteolibacter sp. SL250]